MREVSRQEMRHLEQAADQAGLSYLAMMEQAGLAAAQEILLRVPRGTALVICGRGNNGGDGFVIARLLHQAGLSVRVLLAEGEPATDCARCNFERAAALGIPMEPLIPGSESQRDLAKRAGVCVDALYGTGFHGVMDAAGAAAAKLTAVCPGLVTAVDVPSGVACDSGEACPGAVQADLTVTFHAPKSCHRLAKAFCGQVVVRSIGIERVLKNE